MGKVPLYRSAGSFRLQLYLAGVSPQRAASEIATPKDPTLSLCLGPYGGVSYEQGTPVDPESLTVQVYGVFPAAAVTGGCLATANSVRVPCS